MGQSLKTQILVAAMGGVMLFLAGVLIRTGDSVKPHKKPGAIELPTKLGDATVHLETVRNRPANPAVPKRLSELRALLQSGDRRDPKIQAMVKEKSAVLRDIVSSADWPAVEAEAKKAPIPDGFLGILVSIAGATKADGALPFVVSQKNTVPMKVIEALTTHGSPAAFDALKSIFRGAGEPGLKYLALKGAGGFARSLAEPFFIEAFVGEKDEDVLLEIITLLRVFPSERVVAELIVYLSNADAAKPDDTHLLRAANTLTGMNFPAAVAALFAFYDEPKNPERARHAVGQSIAFLVDPAHVTSVLSKVAAAERPDANLLAYLARSARPGHRAEIESRIDSMKNAEVATKLREILSTLPKTPEK
jgi:hypothetical protein